MKYIDTLGKKDMLEGERRAKEKEDKQEQGAGMGRVGDRSEGRGGGGGEGGMNALRGMQCVVGMLIKIESLLLY